MADDKGSRRLVKFWWVLAFMLGAGSGALWLSFAGLQVTLWFIVFVGAVAVAVAIFEQLGDQPSGHPGFQRNPANRWRARGRTGSANPWSRVNPWSRTETRDKPASRKGQLRAIAGHKKGAEPPDHNAS